MKPNSIRAVAPLHLQPLRWMAYLSVASYYRVAYRIRAWGRLPRRRGPTLVVANHQHEIESPVIVADLGLGSFAWRDPIFTVSSRRMWEPGFLAERIPWMRVLRNVNLGRLFGSIGMQPIENELQKRPFASLAYTLAARHGALRLADVFRPGVLERLPPDLLTLADILAPRHFALSRTAVRLNDVLEPYRSEALQITREELETDIAHFENLQRCGATIFLAPEGSYSGDGRMQRLRGILARLAPLAQIWLTAISYDPYAGRRLTMLYRVVPASDRIPLDTQLKARRPIATSALLCTWLAKRDAPFTRQDAFASVAESLAQLPPNAFVVPELRANLEIAVTKALAGMVRLQTLEKNANVFTLGTQRRHPQFSRTVDMIAYQANFHEETLDGLRAMESERNGDDARS